jgi:hypothetical protein
MKRKVLLSTLVLIVAMSFPVTAFAGSNVDGRVVLGGTYTLEGGDTLDGDLAIFGGVATLEVESLVTGSVLVLGGNLEAYGHINGDLVLLGGNANLSSTTVINGDVFTVGGNVNRAGARIDGEFVTGENIVVPFDFDSFEFQSWSGFPFEAFRFSFRARVLSYLFTSFVLAALAILVVLLFPKPADQVAATVIEQPAISGGMGLLTCVVAIPLFIVMAITICLLPVSFLGIVLFVVAWIYGMVAVGFEVGKRLLTALDQEFQPVLAAGLGTLVVSLVLGGIGFIPCVGWLGSFVVGLIGLGAVLLTRFGSRPYPEDGGALAAPGTGEIVEIPPPDAPESDASEEAPDQKAEEE